MGTIAFAFSGAMVAIEKKMDIFGVAMLGMTTAVGGGIIRDLILDITPPAAFANPVYACTAILISIVVFLPSVRRQLSRKVRLEDLAMLVIDSLGLGVFTVMGVQKAYGAVSDPNVFLAVFVGVITGVGGGILRDICAGDRPYVFIKHFYACASLLGALTCVFLWPLVGEGIAMFAGGSATMILRLLAAHFRWSLPKAQ